MREIFGCLSDNYSCFFIVFGKGTGCWLSFKRLLFPGNGASWFYSRSHSQGPISILKDHSRSAGYVSKCHLAPWRNWPTVCGGLEKGIYYTLNTNSPPFSQREKNAFGHFCLKCASSPYRRIVSGRFGRFWRFSVERGGCGPVCVVLPRNTTSEWGGPVGLTVTMAWTPSQSLPGSLGLWRCYLKLSSLELGKCLPAVILLNKPLDCWPFLPVFSSLCASWCPWQLQGESHLGICLSE